MIHIELHLHTKAFSCVGERTLGLSTIKAELINNAGMWSVMVRGGLRFIAPLSKSKCLEYRPCRMKRPRGGVGDGCCLFIDHMSS